MFLLIDGYNLMHASGVFPPGGSGELQRARRAFLDQLVRRIGPKRAARTTVVFDGREAPPHAPERLTFRGLTVLFSRRGLEADALLEEILARHTHPKNLTVVSSDHRVQRAAKRRKATAADSDVWWSDLAAHGSRDAADSEDHKDLGGLGELDAKHWLKFFGTPDEG